MSWPTKKLGEVCKINGGDSAPQDRIYFHDGQIPFVRMKDLGRYHITDNLTETTDNLTEKVVHDRKIRIWPKGSILMPRSGSVYLNHRAILGVDAAVVSHIAILTDFSPQIWNRYLFYYLTQIDIGAIAQQTTGLDVIRFEQLKELRIPLPPLEEQKRVVEKIEKLFAKIDEASRLREESSADAAALLPSALHQVFSRAEKESWPTKKLGEVATLNPKKSEINGLPENMEVSFVPMSAVDENTQAIIGVETRKLTTVKKGYTYFKENDVLFAKITPCMENGKVAIAQNLKNGIGFGSTEFHVIRPTEQVLAKWIFYIVGSQSFRDEAEKYMTGTAGQQRVPVEFLETFEIPLPPLAEQKKIVAYLDSLSAKARELKNLQSQTAADLSALRQSILSKPFRLNAQKQAGQMIST